MPSVCLHTIFKRGQAKMKVCFEEFGLVAGLTRLVLLGVLS